MISHQQTHRGKMSGNRDYETKGNQAAVKVVKIELTEAEQQWLIENYPTTSRDDCAKYLMVSANTITRFVKELDIKKKRKPGLCVKQPKVIGIRSIGKGYCIDCRHYRKGGVCGRNNRLIGGLHQKECFKAK